MYNMIIQEIWQFVLFMDLCMEHHFHKFRLVQYEWVGLNVISYSNIGLFIESVVQFLKKILKFRRHFLGIAFSTIERDPIEAMDHC